MPADLAAERRAHQMLRWAWPHDAVIAPDAPFDRRLARQGFYTLHQHRRSTAALDAWEAQHPHEPSPELAAYRELLSLGVYGHIPELSTIPFLPSLASDGHYTGRLRDYRAATIPATEGPSGVAPADRRPRRHRRLD